MRAIKIDPVMLTVEQIDLPESGTSLDAMYAAIGCDLVTCESLGRIVGHPSGTTLSLDMWLDDEGANKGGIRRFLMGESSFFGAALVLCSDSEGNTVEIPEKAAEAVLAAMRDSVHFLPVVAGNETRVPCAEVPIFQMVMSRLGLEVEQAEQPATAAALANAASLVDAVIASAKRTTH